MDKQYIYKEKSSLEHYVADAFTVRCVDDRFWKVFKHFLKEQRVKHIDPKSPAGGLKVFSSPEFETDREFYAREIEKSIELHHIKKIMLFSHTECGAYGGASAFGSNKEKEFEFHVNEHKKAKKFLEQKFSGLPVETYFIDEEGVIKIF